MVEKVKKPIYKQVWFWFALIILVSGIGGIVENKDDNQLASENEEVEKSQVEENKVEKTEPNKDTKQIKSITSEKDNLPTEYKSALQKSKTYVEIMNMSKAKLYNQLTSNVGEKFSEQAAQYAVDNIKADWNNNALKKAKIYQNQMNMSPETIRTQLISDAGEKFTSEEAAFAIQHLND
ncbi:Ltp family lipoprotein [Melissococcus plutonius]|uniref:Putative superinfection immunity protein n=1 Tax=Melissococcus plutonius TaxID=33970 RepID=A0A2Z5Y2D8_9ENTE|nr:Ltp family lipoprotein [Melissococcus plutonius]BAL62161.1 hypothetical protein MPD5_0928 [Melissococcus plutonius DAT561]MCV2497929.1 Ltp family lipoprotein [Melissococcus plutonius]MCV2500464.1 Ltp family lipoprotein [Melissococcus plutonius]MCV2505269.1 Ltp family lipoprotein [Melissococcus plutonius]MCV2506544.1 Ltp family lipoprotein [Melissococcus plutonius]